MTFALYLAFQSPRAYPVFEAPRAIYIQRGSVQAALR